MAQGIYQTIYEHLSCKSGATLVTLIGASGSTPRDAGAKMAVLSNGQTIGTIGGGRLEAEMERQARDLLITKSSRIINFTLDGKDAAQSDMICGGSGRALLQYLNPADANVLAIYEKAAHAELTGKKGWIVAQFNRNEDEEPAIENLCFFDEEAQAVGQLTLSDAQQAEMRGSFESILLHTEIFNSKFFYVEPVKLKTKAYIFGGGHISKEIARLLNYLDFRTIILDDRETYANAERFPESENIVIESYANLPPLRIDPSDFLVVVTRGHLGDYDVLRQIIHTPAAYIGMIGSRTKQRLIYDRLIAEGLDEKALARVHSPIGLPIKAETPAEIAISIAAEMILIRAELK